MHPLDAHELVAHKEEVQNFLDAYTQDRLHHAWLFTGNKGIGKAALVYKLALFLLSNPQSPETIEVENPSLKTKIKNGSHPDILVLSSEDEDGEIEEINVERVRKINEFLRLTSIESKYRVVIIDAIDEMNQNAANAFLKILEEPPANVVFLLTCHSIGKILATIRSRCRIVKMKNLSEEDFTSIMRMNGVADSFLISDLFELSDGSLNAALMLYEGENLNIYNSIKKLLNNKARTQSDIMELAKLAGDKKNWKVVKYALSREFYNLAKSAGTKELVLDHIQKLQKFIADSEKFHLDKAQVVTSLFV